MGCLLHMGCATVCFSGKEEKKTKIESRCCQSLTMNGWLVHFKLQYIDMIQYSILRRYDDMIYKDSIYMNVGINNIDTVHAKLLYMLSWWKKNKF
jgi:hypothetical protein